MDKVRVSKNLYRGSRIRTLMGVYWLWILGVSIAWEREDGSYMVRPAAFFARWGDDGVRSMLGRLYRVKRY